MLNSLILKINQYIPNSSQVFKAHQNKVIALEIDNFPTAYFKIQSERLTVSQQDEADVTISGNLFELTQALMGKRKIGALSIVGDINLAQDLFNLYRKDNIPFDEILNQHLPASISFPVMNALADFGKWAQDTIAAKETDLKFFLHDETQHFITPTDANVFYHEVDSLRHRVERFEAKLNLFENKAKQDDVV